MTGAERGFLLLCSSLGRQDRPILTLRQFRLLGRRALMEDQPNLSGEVTEELLLGWGYEAPMAQRILGLLSQERELDRYLARAEELGIGVLTRISPDYPEALLGALGQDAPAVLFYAGDPALFSWWEPESPWRRTWPLRGRLGPRLPARAIPWCPEMPEAVIGKASGLASQPEER